MDHPFWKKRFLLKDTKDLVKLRNSPVKEVTIDTAKGKDVLVNEAVQAEVTIDEVLDDEVLEDDVAVIEKTQEANNIVSEKTAVAIKEAVQKPAKKITVAEEIDHAQSILSDSKAAVTQMFDDVRLGKVVNKEAAMPLVNDISDSIDRNKAALLSLARLKTQDDYSYMHSVAVCALMTALARALNLSDDEVQQAGLAGLLHDIGKATVPLEILNKPGALTDEEFDLIKQHPGKGHELLIEAGIEEKIALDVCLNHHEKVSGNGYPNRLAGDEISIYAKMGAICDVYDAVTSDRPYKKGWSPAESIKKMAQWKGHFDSNIFQAFVKSVGIYPVGSMVKLSSERLAVVIDQSEETLLKPVVKVFYGAQSKAPIPTELIDLSSPHVYEKIVSLEEPSDWGIENFNKIWLGSSH